MNGKAHFTLCIYNLGTSSPFENYVTQLSMKGCFLSMIAKCNHKGRIKIYLACVLQSLAMVYLAGLEIYYFSIEQSLNSWRESLCVSINILLCVVWCLLHIVEGLIDGVPQLCILCHS